MNYQEFYRKLFAPLEREVGRLDPDTLTAIVGFDAGGSLSFCTIGAKKRAGVVTYVSCELAVREEQVPSGFGRYELMTSCDDERWVSSVITEVGRMSLEVSFDHHHTLDIGPWVDPGAPVQGVIFEKAYSQKIDGESYGVLRCIGVSRSDMELAQKRGAAAAIGHLKKMGAYPKTTDPCASARSQGRGERPNNALHLTSGPGKLEPARR